MVENRDCESERPRTIRFQVRSEHENVHTMRPGFKKNDYKIHRKREGVVTFEYSHLDGEYVNFVWKSAFSLFYVTRVARIRRRRAIYERRVRTEAHSKNIHYPTRKRPSRVLTFKRPLLVVIYPVPFWISWKCKPNGGENTNGEGVEYKLNHEFITLFVVVFTFI